MNRIFKLQGKSQHYAWGGYDFIPNWLGIDNIVHKNYAEYWMGAHPSASSTIVDNNQEISLQKFIEKNPSDFLGEKVYQQFGELPYLFKILDVKDMLSIQVHPSKSEAEKGFDAEEKAGIPINAPHRNYKDRNHKPEVMVALSEFWLLHGFLQPKQLLEVLQKIEPFHFLIHIFNNNDYKSLYRHVMEMPQEQVNLLLKPLVLKAIADKKSGILHKYQPEWWVAKLYENETEINDIDKGIFSIYFFNIVEVLPGRAVFQGAGIPHAYLEGQNVELMANSDNVLRGGLTPKHVDVPELLKHTLFEGVTPVVMQGVVTSPSEKQYPCPVPDFAISQVHLQKNNTHKHTSASFEIITVIKGRMDISGEDGTTINVKKGECAAIAAKTLYNITSHDDTLMYVAAAG